MNDLPKVFKEFNEARRNGFIEVKKLKDAVMIRQALSSANLLPGSA